MASLRSYMSECLRMSDYNVLEASTGEEAVEIAGRERGIDLIVCGAILPGMSGLDVAECIARTQPDVQMLFISGCAEDAALYPEWLRNSRQFLAAPFEAQELSERVAALVGREVTAATAL
jgi:DNA-binding response OmpR family regulator